LINQIVNDSGIQSDEEQEHPKVNKEEVKVKNPKLSQKIDTEEYRLKLVKSNQKILRK